jgi:hypothetical protein
MKEAKKGEPPRRALLQKGAALTLGAIGLSGAGLAAETRPESDLRLLARRRSQAAPGRSHKAASASVAPSYGELRSEVDGPAVGTFHAASLGATLVPGVPRGPRLELQTFTLEDGMLFGLGAAGADGTRTCAVLGGTGRFAGAHGTYLERETDDPRAGRGVSEFLFRLGS